MKMGIKFYILLFFRLVYAIYGYYRKIYDLLDANLGCRQLDRMVCRELVGLLLV